MNNMKFFEGLINAEQSPIVICDTDRRIVFMNTFAKNKYNKYGGNEITGKLLDNFCDTEAMSKINMVIEWFKEDAANNKIFAVHKKETNEDIYIVAIRDENKNLIGFTSMYECRTPEKTDVYRMD